MKNYKQNIILMSLLNENKTIDFLKKVSGVSNFQNAKNSFKNIRNIQKEIQNDKKIASEYIQKYKQKIDKLKERSDYLKNRLDSDESINPIDRNQFLLDLKLTNRKHKDAENSRDDYTKKFNEAKSKKINQISDLKGNFRKDITVGGLKSAAALAALASAGYGIKKIVDWRKKKKKEEKRKE